MLHSFFNDQSRCPIHGTIGFNEREKHIIDHPFCQRLRHISQLGFASYVYTGATHNRLGHSLGVMHLAGKVFEQIVTVEQHWLETLFSADDLRYFWQILRMAALLHDVGHAPFSHSSEAVLPSKKHLALPWNWYKQMDREQQATHEDFSVAIIYALAQESPPLLSLDEAQDVCSLVDSSIQMSPSFWLRCALNEGQAKNIHPLLKHLISGEIDADRMDYLHRDSHYAGVNYGKFDVERMIMALSCVQTDAGIILALDHNAVHTYEDFLLARLHMFLQVYFHKTLLPFDYYLQRALEEREIELVIDGTLENFLVARDDSVSSALLLARQKPWASRIVYRKTAKRLLQFEHYHPPELQQQVRQRLEQNGIPSLFLQSQRYFSTAFSEHPPKTWPLLIKQRTLGKTHYLPVHKVSLLLEQYHRNVNIQYLYCEPEDYARACELLGGFFEE